MRCTITGGGGQVGQVVVAELEVAHELTLFSQRRLETNHRLVTGDLLSEEDCLRAVDGADVVVHLAAVREPSVDTFRWNTLSTYRIVEAACRQGARRVVLASSNCVYGHCYRLSKTAFRPHSLPIDESHPCEPEDNYGLSKVVSEEILGAFHRAFGIEIAALRLAWVWGDDERRWWVESGRELVDAFADGLWAYVDARDAALAFRLSVEASDLPAAPAYNINATDTMAAADSAELAARVPALAGHASRLAGRTSFFSAERAGRVLGWRPDRSWLDEGSA
jgi:nucleoside-diphosphate-sugar epimerase